MSAPEKLDLFSFDAKQAADEETVSEEQLEAARSEAFAAGREAALADHLASEERRIGELCQQLLTDTAVIAESIDRVSENVARDALEVAMITVGKVLPALIERNAIDEIEGLVKQCLTELRSEPRVAIRLHAQSLEAFKSRLEPIAGTTGYEGKLVLLADDDLAPSDCKVLWAEGGASRTAEDISRTVTAAVQIYLGAGNIETQESPPPAGQHLDIHDPVEPATPLQESELGSTSHG